MKLKSLYIRNFKMLENFEVKKLGRLNLIVGKNNSGKSTLLDALRIYAKNADFSILQRIEEEKDYNSLVSIQIEDSKSYPYHHSIPFIPDTLMTVSDSLFTYGKKNAEICIGESINDCLTLQQGYIEESKTEKIIDGRQINSTSRSLKLENLPENSSKFVLPILSIRRKMNELYQDTYYVTYKEIPQRRKEIFHHSYIPTVFLRIDELADAWDAMVLTNNTEHIKTALKFIEKKVEDIAIVKNDINKKSARLIKIKRSDLKEWQNLSDFGEGIRKILQIALKIPMARGGFLLIDEFENGLHHSIQKKVWEWLFNLAKDFDVQVFATTHSNDVLKAFIEVSLSREAKGTVISLGQSLLDENEGQVVAIEYGTQEELKTILNSGIEIR